MTAKDKRIVWSTTYLEKNVRRAIIGKQRTNIWAKDKDSIQACVCIPDLKIFSHAFRSNPLHSIATTVTQAVTAKVTSEPEQSPELSKDFLIILACSYSLLFKCFYPVSWASECFTFASMTFTFQLGLQGPGLLRHLYQPWVGLGIWIKLLLFNTPIPTQ